MKVWHLNQTDQGGAARAAHRIHHAISRARIESRLYVNTKSINDPAVLGPVKKVDRAWSIVRTELGKQATRLLGSSEIAQISPEILPSRWPKKINKGNADLVHLHWICREMLSIGDLARIRKPIVWTLHDMWTFCGAEHYTEATRWREGYTRHNRPENESGFDINRWTWNRKRRAWQQPMHVVTPSRWLARCVRDSELLRGWPVTVIPNPLDTDIWRPVHKESARETLGLSRDSFLLVFGAIGGGQDPRKGMDLLVGALKHLRGEVRKLELVVIGENRPAHVPNTGFSTHYAGRLYDDVSLRLYYSAADAVVIPSRQDNLPNMGLESLACGTPIAAFDVCGLRDIVVDKKTGALARAFDAEDMAMCIKWIIEDEQRTAELGRNARLYAEREFSYGAISQKYKELYERVLQDG